MTKSNTDKALIKKVAKGDQASLKILYTAYSGSLTAFVQRYLDTPTEAQDVVHDTMLEVWQKADRFAGRSSVKSWIFAIGRNKALDRSRRNARQISREADTETVDEAPNAEEVMTLLEDARAVRACIATLSDLQQSVIHLAFFEDFTYPEIAKILDCPVGTVKTRIMAAKRSLLTCMKESENAYSSEALSTMPVASSKATRPVLRAAAVSKRTT
ncbi:MAG: RNA polymerase sigma factor [Pseudomonadota bacterium]